MLILQTATPDYRKKFFDYLNEHIDGFQLFTGQYYFEQSVKTDNSITYKQPVKNVYLLKRKFLFQTGMWEAAMRASVVVLEMNPRIISNWLILIFRGIRGKKTILWGHAWPRKGENSRSDIIRNFMRKLASSIIVYTKTQEKELKQKMPKKHILAAPNALYGKCEMVSNCELTEAKISNFLYVGRLTKTKKPLFLVKAFAQTLSALPEGVNLTIVGEGEERNNLKEYVKKHGLEKKIKLLGHINDFSMLKNMYCSSIASVSPGYVGLSITQSFAFGIPMIISKDENHSPEIEAAIENETAMFFETDNYTDLGKKLLDAYDNKTKWFVSRKKICSFCKENYSVESMAQAFINYKIFRP